MFLQGTNKQAKSYNHTRLSYLEFLNWHHLRQKERTEAKKNINTLLSELVIDNTKSIGYQTQLAAAADTPGLKSTINTEGAQINDQINFDQLNQMNLSALNPNIL